MSVETSNVAVLQEAYAKWKTTRGARESFLDVVDPAIRFGSLANGKQPLHFTEACCGSDQLATYFDGLTTEWEMIDCDAEDFIAQGEMVVMRGSCAWKNKRTGKILETPKLDVWRMRGGKAVEFFEFYDTAAAYTAAS
jgi:ketosteroid isomerase-like protein